MMWDFGPTSFETLMTGTVLPVLAALLAADALCGLAFLRWMRRRPRFFLVGIAIGLPVVLALSVVVFFWASRQSYGFLGFLGVMVELYLMFLAYAIALFAYLPTLGEAAGGEDATPGAPPPPPKRRFFAGAASVAPVIVLVLVVLAGYAPHPGLLASIALVALASALGFLLLAVPIGVPVQAVNVLHDRGAPKGPRRLARVGWLFLASYALTAAFVAAGNLLSASGSPYGSALSVLALLTPVVLPTVAVSATAAALARRPANPEA